MARPKGTKYIETPERMWQLFIEYKKYVKDNPIKVKDWVGKDGDAVYREKERPLTIEGFENYVANQDVISDLSQYFANTENRYTSYQTICSRIRREVRQEQIEGGMAGIYNPSITQRLNNLVEKVQEDGTKELIVKVKYERKGIDDKP
jgi:hypothetical protein